jgi:regulatory protein YycI of two-component signal transduction system YycFG
MEWSKLKNMILLLLAVTNLCLFIFVAQREIQSDRLERENRENAISFLAEKGIHIAEGQLPQAVTLPARTVERDLEAEETAAAALLGGAVRVEARGSEVYRYYNENGSIQIHSDGAFTAAFAIGTFPLGEDRVEECLSILNTMDFQGELLEADEDQLVFRQTWEGVPLFSQQVTLMCEEDYLTAMTGGRRLVGQPTDDPSRPTITIPTALFDFFNGLNALGDVCSSIDRIDPGYVSTTSLSGPMLLTPVWRIITNTGAYQLDMITGGVTRVN